MRLTTIVSVLVVLGLFGGVGFFVYQNNNDEPKQKAVRAKTTTKKSTESSSSNNADSLSVSNDQSSLGQLGTNQTQDQSSQSNNSTKLLDPSDFEEYDKYIESDQILMQDAKKGTGKEAVSGKKVAVYYKGWLTNGQVFDQTRTNDKGELEPFVFTLGGGQVIKGWDIGVAGMKVGGVRRLVLPPVAAYGETGQGAIPPNAVLIFDVQLLEVEQ